MNIPRDKTPNQPENTVTWLIMLGRFGRLLFSLAIIAIGVETLICSYVSSHSLGPHYKVVPVIPWLPAIPSLAYLVGAILVLCGAGLLFQRTLVVSSVTLGALMLLCGLAFDVPRHPDLMSAPWRTNVLEPIAIGSLAWFTPGLGGIPRWLHRTSRYILAFALIIFGIAHFQILTPIASMVPSWIPWHRFWTLFFGVAFISAGVSFATGCLQRWAALGVGVMFALWLVTIHLPPVLNYLRTPGAPQDPDKWSDVFIVAALWGGFWALARDSRDRKDLSLGGDSTLFTIRAASGLILLTALAQSAVHSEAATPAPFSPPSIDGTYELTERVMANGTVLRAPSIVALYTMADGRFSLNLFVKNVDGTIASESSVGRYTFSADKYCEWIVYTIRNNLDKPGVTNEAPALTDHCAPVTSKDGRFNFSPPGEGVEVSFGAEGFTAKIGGEFVDHWRKIR